MKKLSIMFVVFMAITQNAFASTEQEVLTFFNSYVTAANEYQQNLFSKYYSTSPTIIRVVEKKDGTTQAVTVPFSKYLEESAKGQKLAKITKYKNNYSNIKVTKDGNNFKVTAMRLPSPGGKFPAYFIIGENSSGELKIKVESMNTPRQEFLKN